MRLIYKDFAYNKKSIARRINPGFEWLRTTIVMMPEGALWRRIDTPLICFPNEFFRIVLFTHFLAQIMKLDFANAERQSGIFGILFIGLKNKWKIGIYKNKYIY